MQTRRGDAKFNSTMKNSHQNYSPGNKQSNSSNYNNSDNFSKNWSPQRTGSTDAGSRDTGTSPGGLSMTSSLSTTQETRT